MKKGVLHNYDFILAFVVLLLFLFHALNFVVSTDSFLIVKMREFTSLSYSFVFSELLVRNSNFFLFDDYAFSDEIVFEKFSDSNFFDSGFSGSYCFSFNRVVRDSVSKNKKFVRVPFCR